MKVMLDPNAYIPERAHKDDAGIDLKTKEKVVLWGGSSHVFDTGVHVEIPKGCYGKIESKSGLNVKQSIVSLGGIIDAGYTGSIRVKLYNLSDYSYTFEVGDKIAQLIIQRHEPVKIEIVDELEETERGDSGFGSSGR